MLDDVLDVSGPVERTGKPRGTDLLEGTVTLPLILARARDPELAAFDLASLRTARQALELCERIAATGALQIARERALAVVAEAKAALPPIVPPGRSMPLYLVADLAQGGGEEGLAALHRAVDGLPAAAAAFALEQQEPLAAIDDRHDDGRGEGGEGAPVAGGDRRLRVSR